MSAIRYNAPRGRQYSQGPRRKRQNSRTSPRRKASTGWSMKLGAWAHARLRDAQYDSVSRRVIQAIALIFILGVFTAILSATGVFSATGKMISSKSIAFTRAIGLSANAIEVKSIEGRAMTNAQSAEIEAIAGIPNQQIMFEVNPKIIRDRIMVLPWVEDVIVRRLWPQNIQIIVTPRKANALWQENGTLQYIDPNGKKLGPADPTKAQNLPLIIGENAGEASMQMFDAIAKRPNIANRVHALVRVENRRWNLRLKNGGDILLPTQNYEQALDELESLQQKYQILDREFARLDVRKHGQLIIRPRAEAREANKQNA